MVRVRVVAALVVPLVTIRVVAVAVDPTDACARQIDDARHVRVDIHLGLVLLNVGAAVREDHRRERVEMAVVLVV